MTMPHLNLILFLVFVFLQLLDHHSTLKALELGAREANPVVKFLMNRFGTETGLVIKTVFAIVVGYIAYTLGLTVALAVLNVIYMVVVGNNYRLLDDANKLLR